MRDDHPDGQERPGETPDQEELAGLDAPPASGIRGRAGDAPRGWPGGRGRVAARMPAMTQVEADGGHREALVLLDEDQRQRPPDRGLDAAADQRGQREGQQRDGEGDLVEIEVGHLLQAPGEPVRDRDGPAGPTPSFSRAAWLTGKTDTAASSACAATSVAAEGKTRKKGASTMTIGWKWSPSRLKPGALMSTTGALEAGGLLDVLGVDGQIPRGRVELQQPEQRDGEIGAENGERGHPDERVPVGTDEAPGSRL